MGVQVDVDAIWIDRNGDLRLANDPSLSWTDFMEKKTMRMKKSGLFVIFRDAKTIMAMRMKDLKVIVQIDQVLTTQLQRKHFCKVISIDSEKVPSVRISSVAIQIKIISQMLWTQESFQQDSIFESSQSSKTLKTSHSFFSRQWNQKSNTLETSFYFVHCIERKICNCKKSSFVRFLAWKYLLCLLSIHQISPPPPKKKQ